MIARDDLENSFSLSHNGRSVLARAIILQFRVGPGTMMIAKGRQGSKGRMCIFGPRFPVDEARSRAGGTYGLQYKCIVDGGASKRPRRFAKNARQTRFYRSALGFSANGGGSRVKAGRAAA